MDLLWQQEFIMGVSHIPPFLSLGASEEEPENLLKSSKRPQPVQQDWVDQVTGICAKLKRGHRFGKGVQRGGGRRAGLWADLPCLSPLCWQSAGALLSHLALPRAGRPTWASGPGRSASARACFTSVQPPSSQSSGC